MNLPPPQPTAMKRLLSPRQRPKQMPKSGPGPSIVPPDDQLLLPPKKTRDLPNLSDCHGCSKHINHTNPKDRLQTLDSVWRIVLLCRKCIKRVEMGQACPYCFKESGNAECLKCRDCDRVIHKDCLTKNGHSPPWSLYKSELGAGLEFTVCIDCWVPKMFRKSIRIRRRKNVWKGSEKSGSDNSKCLKNDSWTREGALCFMGREIVLALRAQREVSPRAEARRNTEELANAATNAVAEKDKNGKKNEGLARSHSGSNTKCCHNMSERRSLGDAELAFQLHRAMNSSSRNFKNSCSSNTGCLDVFPHSSNEIGSRGYVGRLKPGIITYKRRKSEKRFITYKRGCLKRKSFLENVGANSSVLVRNNSGNLGKAKSDSCSGVQDELKCDHLSDADLISKRERDDDGTNPGTTLDEKTERFLLTYSRRPKGCKLQASCENDTSLNGNQVYVPEVPMNCSTESRAFSDVSLNSCVVDLQSSSCVGDPQENSP